MAQKTHPIGLRLGVSHTWDSSWHPNRNEGNHYSELLHKDLELRRLIQHFVEESHGVLLGSVHIQNAWVNQKDVSPVEDPSSNETPQHANQTFVVHLRVHSLGKENIPWNTLNETMHQFLPEHQFLLFVEDFEKNERSSLLWSSLQDEFKMIQQKGVQIQPLLSAFHASVISGRSQFINRALVNQLQRTPMHTSVLDLADKLVASLHEKKAFRGLRIQMKGRLNGADRSRTEKIQHGQIPLQSLKAKIDYSTGEFFTPFGMSSLKVWLLP